VVDSPRRRRLTALAGTRRPSSRQIRCTRLWVQREAFGEQVAVGTAVAPAGPLFGDLAQPRSQSRVVIGNLRTVALCGAVLAGNPARPALGEAEAVLQHADRLAPLGRAQKFPLAISL
jgi:hypothetical protein